MDRRVVGFDDDVEVFHGVYSGFTVGVFEGDVGVVFEELVEVVFASGCDDDSPSVDSRIPLNSSQY